MSIHQEVAAGSAERAVADLTPLSLSRSVIGDRHGRRDYIMRRLLVEADVCALLLSFVVAAAVDELPGSDANVLLWGLLTMPMWVVLFKLYGLYDRDLKRVSHSTVDDIPWLFHGVVIGTLLTWVLFKALPPGKLPFASILAFSLCAITAVLALRSFVRGSAVRVLGPERVVLVGDEKMAHVLVRKMRAHPEYGLEPLGVILPGGRSQTAPAGLPVLNTSGESIAMVAREHRVDRLVVSHSGLSEDQVLDIVRRCKGLAIKVSLLPQVFDALGPSVEIDDVEGVTLLGINPPVLGRSSRTIKRCLDLVGATLLLVLLLPLFAVIAIAIKLDELPQLWNVLRGEMSLVGPRPLIESEDRMVGGWGRSRLDLTPGMTGVWQVLGRTNIPFDEMVKLDYLYVTNWTLWTDIRLLLRTLPVVLARRGAN